MFTDTYENRIDQRIRGMETPFSFSKRAYPLNPSASVAFTLEEAQEITLSIYDSYGRVIHTLYDQVMMKPGYHELQLYGDIFPAGECYARLITKFGVQQRTLIMNAHFP